MFKDPPNVQKGLYVNVYIAEANGNGVGTENPEFVPFINLQNIVRSLFNIYYLHFKNLNHCCLA